MSLVIKISAAALAMSALVGQLWKHEPLRPWQVGTVLSIGTSCPRLAADAALIVAAGTQGEAAALVDTYLRARLTSGAAAALEIDYDPCRARLSPSL